jgi:epoxide hydrolase-like predicted phosphatase
MIQGIIFDCFGVLYHGSLGYLRTLVLPEHSQELEDLSHSYDAGHMSQDDYFNSVGSLIGKTANDVDSICQEQHFRNEDMIELVRSLRSHYKVALLSNVGRGFIEQLFTPDDLSELFDVEILSNEVGMVKPNKDIYELAASRLGLTPESCVMIDDLLVNIIGAQNAGMSGIVCKTTQQVVDDLNALLDTVHA